MLLLREPLIHFLAIGIAVFGLYMLISDVDESVPAEHIVVTAGDMERLSTLWQKQWLRPPTEEELDGLIAEHVRQEVLYREALALGLDMDDTVVRRRLAQKFEFLIEDLVGSREPTEAELTDYYAANRERYKTPTLISFTQIYFSSDSRGTSVEADAVATLASLREGRNDELEPELGDKTMLDARFPRQTPREIEANFGREFADALAALSVGDWSGPFHSGYGLHLVRIDEQIEGSSPELREIEAKVRADWAHEQRTKDRKELFGRLRAKYTVVIEGMQDAASVAGQGIDQVPQ